MLHSHKFSLAEGEARSAQAGRTSPCLLVPNGDRDLVNNDAMPSSLNVRCHA